MVKKTTAKEYKLFKDTFLKYQKLLGLTGYQVRFKLAPIEDCYATIQTSPSDMVVTVSLCDSNTIKELDNFDAVRSAKHEAVHLLLARMSHLMSQRYSTEKEENAAEEEVVNKLVRLLD